jgi:hypothetical protein
MKYKCLSIRQPHADRIARGVKTIELRTWRTSYRGPLLICASQKHPGYPYRDMGLPLGCAVCLVNLVDCREIGVNAPDTLAADAGAACCELDPRDDFWGFVLAGAKKIQPFPVKGRLGFYDVEADLLFLA